MRSLLQKSKPAQHAISATPSIAPGAHQSVRQLTEETMGLQRDNSGSPRFTHDFSRVPVHARTPVRTQAKLEVSRPGDVYEREADRVSAQVMRMPEPQVQRECSCGGQCPKCSEDEKNPEHVQRQATAAPAHGNSLTASLSSPVHDVIRNSGQVLDPVTRGFMEPRFGYNFAGVRVHVGDKAAQSAAALSARAYTLGNRIVFGAGQYQPNTASGRQLIAHELTHVIQQDSAQPRLMRQAAPQAPAATPPVEEEQEQNQGREVGGGPGAAHELVVEHGGERIARDLAVPPTVANPAEPILTAAQIQAAIRFNAFRFKDPYSIAVVRDIVGVPRFPAVSDEDMARGVARYQASYGLTQDGQVGPATTARLVTEAGAENLPADAEQLRRDNFVTWAPAAGVHRGCAAGLDAGGLPTFFQWDVNFSTSLRNGWLVQEIVNTRVRNTCGGGVIPETLTPHYWEAWFVDRSGNVLIPTTISADRTRATATAVPAPAHDLWRRASAAPSTGNWRMSANLFTCIRLPAGFAVGNVRDALALPSTAAAPNADDLGQVEASRSAAGQWNCCGPPATHFHNPV